MSYSYNYFMSSEFEYDAAAAEVRKEIAELPEDQRPDNKETLRRIYARKDGRMAKLARIEREGQGNSKGMRV